MARPARRIVDIPLVPPFPFDRIMRPLQKKANGLWNASLHSIGHSRILAQGGSRRTKSNPLAALHVAD